VAAALGREVEIGTLSALTATGPDDLDRLLDPARAEALIVDAEPGRVAFGHDLLRDAVHRALPAGERQAPGSRSSSPGRGRTRR
jgi:hypothetical protein